MVVIIVALFFGGAMLYERYEDKKAKQPIQFESLSATDTAA